MKRIAFLAAVGFALAAPAFAQAACIDSDAYQLGRQRSMIPAVCQSDSSYMAAYQNGARAGTASAGPSANWGVPAALVAGAVIGKLIADDDDDNDHDRDRWHSRDRDHHHVDRDRDHDRDSWHHRSGDRRHHASDRHRNHRGNGHHKGHGNGHHKGHGNGHHR